MAKVVLTWKLEHQYRATFETEAEWNAFVTSVSNALDPTNLDLVYEYLNERHDDIGMELEEMASDDRWVGTTDYEVVDLERVSESPQADS